MYQKLKNICEAKGINITQLCKQVTGSSGNLSTWKKGYMRSDYLSKSADILEVSTDYLLDRTDEPQTIGGHSIKTGSVGDNSSNNDTSVKISDSIQGKLDEMSAELLKKFGELSFDEKIDVFNYIKNKKEL